MAILDIEHDLIWEAQEWCRRKDMKMDTYNIVTALIALKHISVVSIKVIKRRVELENEETAKGIHNMTPERFEELWGDAQFTRGEKDRGWHYCPDYDNLHVGRESGEWGDNPSKCICGHPVPNSDEEG